MPTATPAPINAVAENPGIDWSSGLIFLGLILLMVILRSTIGGRMNRDGRKAATVLGIMAAVFLGSQLFGRAGLAITVTLGLVGMIGYLIYQRRNGSNAKSATTPQ